MIAFWFAAASFAATPTVSVAAGNDFPTDEWWTGAQVALQPSGDALVQPVGRLVGAYGLIDGTPLAIGEIGAMVRVPSPEATVRVGLLARPELAITRYRPPIALAHTGSRYVGLIPGGLAQLEFEWTPEAPFALGVKGGMASSVTDVFCDEDATDRTTCVSWFAGFVGGFTVRKQFANGLSGEVILGTQLAVSIGWAFPARD